MSGIDNAKKCMGWQHPNERACCVNCAHCKTGHNRPGERTSGTSFTCVKGAFMTSRHAWCRLHVVRAAGTIASEHDGRRPPASIPGGRQT